jgi:hypothetical protein
MSEWRIRVWRVVALGVVVALLLGMIVILPAYLHMRGVAAGRAAEIKTLGAQLDESRRAHEASLAENRVTAETLKGTASELESLRVAQQALADEDRETSQTLQDTTVDLGQLHAAQQLALCETQETTQSLTETAVSLEEFRVTQETTVAETQQATAGLEELHVAEQATADQNRETSQALTETAKGLEELRVAQEMTANEYREMIQDLQDAIGQLATTGRPSWPGGPSVPSVTTPSTEAPEGYSGVDADEASALWVDGFSALRSQESPSTTGPGGQSVVSVFDDHVAAQAKSLIWKHLGRPPYRLFVISQTQSTVQNLWHVMGRFAGVGEDARAFAAGVRFLPSGKWMLLSFCWLAVTAPTDAEPAAPAAAECPPCPPTP